ncbi:hypothetical protein BU26DRAFT_142431 [Trematosphaeria pertusa]|uniref:Uncharacterized protein n=1 Tax=Trematosphaeria pertusa TaxID=390896 RepID=A0A6A6IZP1_9PLEO|nr:uncharacterized protein BU26DRAFT_142431 [Trematosphaeria pertusa]KAF2254623.1 hypothetical protein BU26DRAFT_142431 [Trematosphaeria pertusa]
MRWARGLSQRSDSVVPRRRSPRDVVFCGGGVLGRRKQALRRKGAEGWLGRSLDGFEDAHRRLGLARASCEGDCWVESSGGISSPVASRRVTSPAIPTTPDARPAVVAQAIIILSVHQPTSCRCSRGRARIAFRYFRKHRERLKTRVGCTTPFARFPKLSPRGSRS